MNIQVTFRHIPSSSALKQYAEEKITKLIKSLKEPIEVHIIFTQEKKNNTVELTLTSAGKELYAKERGGDMYAAIDLIHDKLDKQIKKLKEKKKKHTGIASMKHLQQAGFADEEEDKDEVMVIPEKDYFVRPMTTEEAVLQLDISETPFLVYLDAGAERVNVVFKRDDGQYGLIETGARYK
ncbi:MAG: ribosome-associated translation inhibitor RaiA [Deltaproteobacteria bacterium]|nr:ribosome-associated translation inhibitor RaiA [Deltaproteobacteria bacterium]MCL5879012.1 ribosome-associated translation inhibitor RaiA [Deltaproteobacteria bacterium]